MPVTLAYTVELIFTMVTLNEYIRRSLLYLQGHTIALVEAAQREDKGEFSSWSR